MSKYLYVYRISLKSVLQRRSSLLMDRVGGLATILALYYFWASLLPDGRPFLGYSRGQMLSYVLMMSLLRAFVLTGRGWELVREISMGRLSNFLLRPVSYLGYSLASDLAQKSVHLASAALEVAVLLLVLRAPVFLPARPWTLPLFAASVLLSSLLFFLLEFLVASMAFWTSESGGPLFCFNLFLQFAAGAFFPLDVLPRAFQDALRMTPFPYLVFLPLNIYLERTRAAQALAVLGLQALWLGAAFWAVRAAWGRGLRSWAAEGG